MVTGFSRRWCPCVKLHGITSRTPSTFPLLRGSSSNQTCLCVCLLPKLFFIVLACCVSFEAFTVVWSRILCVPLKCLELITQWCSVISQKNGIFYTCVVPSLCVTSFLTCCFHLHLDLPFSFILETNSKNLFCSFLNQPRNVSLCYLLIYVLMTSWSSWVIENQLSSGLCPSPG